MQENANQNIVHTTGTFLISLYAYESTCD